VSKVRPIRAIIYDAMNTDGLGVSMSEAEKVIADLRSAVVPSEQEIEEALGKCWDIDYAGHDEMRVNTFDDDKAVKVIRELIESKFDN